MPPSSVRQRLTRRGALKAFGVAITGGVSGTAASVYSSSAGASDPAIVGHRGAAGLEPANTIASIETALDYDIDGIELDVRQTSDGTLVLFHDPVLDWATDGHGRIEETVWADLDAVEFHGEPIPTLADGLAVMADADVDIYLELKGNGFTDDVVQTVGEFGLSDRLTVMSFDPGPLSTAADRGVATGLLGKVPNPLLVDTAIEQSVDAVSSHYSPYGLDWFVNTARDKGIHGGVWHLTETEEVLEDVLAAEPNHLTTNRPDLAVEAMHGR